MRGLSRLWRSSRRRGAVAGVVAIILVALCSFVALTIDIGQLHVARAELQRAADAAAMAGASGYFSEAELVQNDLAPLVELIQNRAAEVSLRNPTLGEATILDAEDIRLGTYNADADGGSIDWSGTDRLNTVQVTVRKTSGSSNGPVNFFFAPIFGVTEGGRTATATAVADDRFAGFRFEYETHPTVMPFTLHVDLYEQMVVGSTDEYSWNGDVVNLPDGTPEIVIYPNRIKTTGSSDPNDPIEYNGAGNFGALNIGINSQSNDGLRDQILEGITPEQMEAEIGSREVMYYDEESGEPLTQDITGNTGLSASLGDAIAERVGELVGFFVHTTVMKEGSNTIFTTVGIRFGLLMEVDLRGALRNKRLVIQPAPYVGQGVIVSESAPSSNGQIGRIALVR